MPNFWVGYEREYLIVDDVRISIDKNLVYKSFKTNRVHDDSNIIVEIKTSIKKNMDDLVVQFPFQRVRFSKYCFAADSLKQTG